MAGKVGSSYGGNMGSIIITDDTLNKNLDAFPDRVKRGLEACLGYWAPQVQSAARSGAPWTDRTGNARQGLFAKAYTDGEKMGIVLYHSVPYGIWLEVRWSGRYAIIIPTIQKMGPQVMATIGSYVARAV
jgi:hypothetical protein